ncbi:MAG: hypothetical protein KAS93_05875 [Gammaproteobacteria bacterium]|nr:hypothetical protein [Gammaproteobacteria bacterium]
MFAVQRKIFFCGIALGLLMLAGCAVTPNTLGISAQTWHKYSKAKQQALIVGYHSVSSFYKSGQAKHGGRLLQVVVAHGTVKMPPFVKSYTYRPVIFTIPEGVCRSVILRNQKAQKQVAVGACYKHGILLLDPSRYDVNKRLGSIRFYKSPLWRQGFSYRNVHSTGFVRLKDATITIRIKDATKTKRK